MTLAEILVPICLYCLLGLTSLTTGDVFSFKSSMTSTDKQQWIQNAGFNHTLLYISTQCTLTHCWDYAHYRVCVLVYKCLHQAAPTYITELCSLVSESANHGHLRSAAQGDLAVPRSRTRDTAKDVLLFLDQPCGTHSHCQFVTYHWHWLSSVCLWKLCYSAGHTKH